MYKVPLKISQHQGKIRERSLHMKIKDKVSNLDVKSVHDLCNVIS